MFFNLLTDYNTSGLYISSILLIVAIFILAFIFDSKHAIDTKTIAFAGISIALSYALSFVKLFSLPQGGSITLASLLPLLLFSYFYGARLGVFAGIILGLLNMIIEPWIVHPAQALLDYPIAFASIGLCGIFKNLPKINKHKQLAFTLGAIAGSLLRFFSHTLSGVYAFSVYATFDLWAYSLAYNSFVLVDIAISIVVGSILLSSNAFVSIFEKHN